MSIETSVDDREARYAAHRRMQWKIGFGVAGTGVTLGVAFGALYHYSMPVVARCYDAITQYLSR